MEECSYCGDRFDDEDDYLDHLAAEHEDELSAIDRRRIDGHAGGGDSGLPTGPLVLGGVVAAAVLLVVYVTFFLGGASGQPGLGQPGTAHEHGTINVTIDGRTVDFSQREYQLQADRFHFEGGTAVWHKHATGVTLAFAMETVGIEVTEDSVTFEGTTYRDGDPGTDVVVEVNGESVDPDEYVLQGARSADAAGQGDRVRIVVRTS
jgi:hypothetical protein